MRRLNTFKLKASANLCALAVASLLFSVALPIRAQMQDMRGMKMGRSKSSSKSRSRRAARKRALARNKGGMRGMNMKGMKMPSSARASSRSKNAPRQKMEMNMQGMQMPTSSPQPSSSATPQPSASPQMEMNMPGMNGQAQTPSTQPSVTPDQMKMPGMQMPQSSTPSANQTNPHATHDQMGGMENMSMSGTNEKGQPPNMTGMNMPGMEMGSNGTITSRSGSGTMWQPASTPMHMLHMQKGDWMIMFHGDAKVGVNSQGGLRGVTKFESENWLMAMASRKVGRGTLDLRSMFSLEPLTFSGSGSPELFQTGETYKGQPLRNAQHPHDLFMTLSASYTLPMGEHGTWFGYFGFPGEPALGPVAFMHRASAAENPTAPLAHHLEDSTHISFGVFTTGFTYRQFKLEGSLFNGREPDENRYNFEFHPWNSRSVRLQFAPDRNWAMQVSYGLLKNPEAQESGDVRRATASVSYNKPLERGNWATTLIWGRNHEDHDNKTFIFNGYTAESTLQFINRNYIYTRLELVDKTDLLDSVDRLRLGITDAHPIFRIGAYTFGAARDIWETARFTVALGGDVTFYSKPGVLDSVYGNNPTSYHLFLRFRLGRMSVGEHDMGKTASSTSTAVDTRP